MRTVLVTTEPCMLCDKTSELEVDADAYEAWRRGALIQEVFPDLSLDERELLKTGTCAPCWERL